MYLLWYQIQWIRIWTTSYQASVPISHLESREWEAEASYCISVQYPKWQIQAGPDNIFSNTVLEGYQLFLIQYLFESCYHLFKEWFTADIRDLDIDSWFWLLLMKWGDTFKEPVIGSWLMFFFNQSTMFQLRI